MTEQGTLFPGAPPETEQVLLEGQTALGLTPEGTERSVPLSDLIDGLLPSLPTTCGLVLPDGVKAILPGKGGVVVVHETPPQPMSLRWIAADSDERLGPEASYRTVRLALPYVIVLALFGRQGERLQLLGGNECFFLNEPLRRLDQELLYPALLNCSRFPDGAPRPLSWICTQHLDIKRLGRGQPEQALAEGLSALRSHLFGAAFNESSERHELSSWFTETVEAQVDPRLATVEAWEEASREDPLFVLDVPWLPTGHTVEQVAERALSNEFGPRRAIRTAGDVLRVVLSRPS